MKKDNAISFVRVLATLFIVICHICSHLRMIALSQFFNVGIPIFFLISGYLYGSKQIKNPGQWVLQRYLRLEIPAIIWLVIICISALIRRTQLPALHSCVFLLLNLQGLNFIFPTMEDLFVGPWFFTNIMACYLCFLCYSRIEEKHHEISKIFSYGGIIPLAFFVLLAMLGVSTDGLLAFFAGVVIHRKKLLENLRFRSIFLFFLYFVLAVGMRLTGKHFIDGTRFYDEVVAPATHIIIASSIFASCKWLFQFVPGPLNALSENKAFRHLDTISIYVYISHDMLFTGTVLSVFNWNMPMPILLVLLMVLIILFASALWFIGTKITNGIEKSFRYLFV